MSTDQETIRNWIEELEQILLQLDSINADIAAIHVDIAIGELCQIADVQRTVETIRAA